VTDHVKVQVAPGQEPVIQSIALDEELADRAIIGNGLANAEMPDIVDATLYLTASINLDLETKSMLSIQVRADAVSTTDVVNLALDVDGSPDGDNSLDHPLASMLDTLVFAPGFGSDASVSASNVNEVIDVSASGFKTLQELLDSGALVQSGADVVLTIDPSDPAHSDRITLRDVDLSVLTAADFKF
jgi:hypothetical protein